MDLAAIFLLPLLGGYCFAYIWRATAYATRRAEGHHLYFRAALCGVMFFSLALAIRTTLASGSPAFLKFDSTLVEYVRPVLKIETGLVLQAQTRRVGWVITAIYSLLLGTGCGVTANMFTPRRWALRRSTSAFEGLLMRAYFKGFPVSITLRSGKVYVGSVATIPDPARDSVAVTLLPILSGNRDADGRLTLITDYETVYANLRAGRAMQLGLPADWEESQFELLVRADEIVIAARFSPVIYAEFNPGWRQQIAQPR